MKTSKGLTLWEKSRWNYTVTKNSPRDMLKNYRTIYIKFTTGYKKAAL